MRTGKDAVLLRLASAANNYGLTPNMMTALGLCLGVASGVMFMLRALPFAFAFGFLSVFCDVLDGTLARRFHMESRFGKAFDSVADRTTEAAVVMGALMGGIVEPAGLVAIVGSVSLLGFRTLSYARGFNTDYVWFGRAERLAFILMGLLSPVVPLSTACFVVAGGFGVVSSLQIAISLLRQRFKQ